MSSIHKLVILEANALRDETLDAIQKQISEGPVTDPEEFNLMMMTMRNALNAQARVITSLGREIGVTP